MQNRVRASTCARPREAEPSVTEDLQPAARPNYRQQPIKTDSTRSWYRKALCSLSFVNKWIFEDECGAASLDVERTWSAQRLISEKRVRHCSVPAKQITAATKLEKTEFFFEWIQVIYKIAGPSTFRNSFRHHFFQSQD